MNRKKRNVKTGRKLMTGFLTLIFLGAVLLSLPFSHNEGQTLSFLDAIFISTSAVCVTGLTPLAIRDVLSCPGRVVLALLIQIGGLGYSTFALFFHILLRQRISFSQQNLAKEALNQETGRSTIDLVKLIARASLSIELIGAFFLFLSFRERLGVAAAIGSALFHSVSAFNNAGFDLFGNSMCDYSDALLPNLTIMALIITGGIGFFVLSDVIHKKKWKKFSMHTRIVLTMTFCLIVIGALLLRLVSDTTWLEAFFLSVSARTAGFNSVDVKALGAPALVLVILLMFIGASPGSTGGGIKTSTFFTIVIAIRSVITRKETNAFHRRIGEESIMKAFCVLFLFLMSIFIGVFALSVIERNIPFLDLLFEAVSAIGTVGLSCGITGTLAPGSKIILISLMFIGRLGPLTVVSSLSRQSRGAKIHCVEEHIIIG